jgi:hypothetical protein
MDDYTLEGSVKQTELPSGMKHARRKFAQKSMSCLIVK